MAWTRIFLVAALLVGLAPSAQGKDSVATVDQLVKGKKLRAAERLCRRLAARGVATGARLERIHTSLRDKGFVQLGALWVKKKSVAKLPKSASIKTIEVLRSHGDVKVRAREGEEPKPLGAGGLRPNQEVIVGTPGQLHLSIGHGTKISIGAGSILRLNSKRKATTSFRPPKDAFTSGLGSLSLVKGRLHVTVTAAKKSPLRRTPLVIETPTALLAVRGTAFSVDAALAGSTIRVLEGKVEVRSALEPEKSIKVGARSAVTASEEALSPVRTMTRAELTELESELARTPGEGFLIEAEDMQVVAGKTAIYDRGNGGGGYRRWDAPSNDKSVEVYLPPGTPATLKTKVPKAGRYELRARLSPSPGKRGQEIQFAVNGKPLGKPLWISRTTVSHGPIPFDLGLVRVEAGKTKLTLEVAKWLREKADDPRGIYIYIDTIRLESKKRVLSWDAEEVFKTSSGGTVEGVRQVGAAGVDASLWTNKTHWAVKELHEGDRLDFVLPVPKGGTYRLVLNLTKAPNTEALLQAHMGGEPVGPPIFAHRPRHIYEEHVLGTVELEDAELVLEMTGSFPNGVKIELDYLRLVEVD